MSLYLITIKNGTRVIGVAESKDEAIKFAREETARKYRHIRVEYHNEVIWFNY